ncbi:MAG: hypothetical protein UHS51_13410 [Atopobiaceae bacterium]|jgi:hypothetical protein|nr:hypothetical protein [Atopobiaceae bacterium]
MNVWDVVLVAGIVAAVALAVASLRKTRRAGGCASCPFAGDCGNGRNAKKCEPRHE